MPVEIGIGQFASRKITDQTAGAFPIGCRVKISGDMSGIVHRIGPDFVGCLLEHCDVVDFEIEKVERI